MKKIIFILLAAAIAAYLGATAIAGVFIAGEVDKYRQELTARNDIKVNRLEYERGFFGGNLHYDIVYTPLSDGEVIEAIASQTEEGQPVIPIKGVADVKHGPYVGGPEGFALALTQTRWPLPDKIHDYLPGYPADEHVAEAVTTMGFNGVIKSVVTGRDYDGIIKSDRGDSYQEAVVVLKNWGANVMIGNQLDHIEMSAHIGKFAVTIEEDGTSHDFRIGQVVFDLDSTRRTPVLWTGDAAFTINELEFREDDSLMVINDLAMQVASIFKEDVFDNRFLLHTGKMDIDGLYLNGLTFDMSLNDIDVDAYERFVYMLEQSIDIDPDNQQVQEEVIESGKEIVAQFLAAGPSFNIDALNLHVMAPDDVSAYLKLYYPPSSPVNLEDPEMMLGHFGMKGGASISVSALERISRLYAEMESREYEKEYGKPLSGEEIDDAAQRSYSAMIVLFHFMPYFTVSEEGVSSRLEIREGRVFANGQEIMGVREFIDTLF